MNKRVLGVVVACVVIYSGAVSPTFAQESKVSEVYSKQGIIAIQKHIKAGEHAKAVALLGERAWCERDVAHGTSQDLVAQFCRCI